MKKIDIIKSSREYTEIINLNKNKRNKYFSIYYRKNNKDNSEHIRSPVDFELHNFISDKV